MNKKNSKKGKYVLIGISVLALIFIIYSLYTTFKSGSAEEGIVVCVEDGRCFWQAHYHVYVPITICGEELRLPLEKGSLQGPHTHEEKNIIHWHDRTGYDKENKKIIDSSQFKLGTFFDEIEVNFSRTGVSNKNNGDICPDGIPGSIKMFVNGKENKLFREYVWKDKDVILIVFDSRSSEDVEKELSENPIMFPSLGRG